MLLETVEQLRGRFKVVFVGDGTQRKELESCLEGPGLKGRAYYAGLLARARLLAVYPVFDVLVVPSLSMSYWTEQFGCVLAEAMACGVPVIGSNSGAIPETIGDAGLIVPEGNVEALAAAILKLSESEELRRRSIAKGLARYRSRYSCEAYARSVAGLLNIP